jgi:hypothetical protein
MEIERTTMAHAAAVRDTGSKCQSPVRHINNFQINPGLRKKGIEFVDRL